jgi:hypothetical protein
MLCSVFRFPPSGAPPEEMLGRYSAPGRSKSRCGYPYFQSSPQYSGQHECSQFESTDTACRCLFDGATSSRPGPHKQLQATPGASLPKRPAHQVRFQLPADAEQKQPNEVSPSALALTGPPKAYKVCRCRHYAVSNFWRSQSQRQLAPLCLHTRGQLRGLSLNPTLGARIQYCILDILHEEYLHF